MSRDNIGISEMVDSAKALMAEQGIEREQISPEVVVLATNSPRAIKHAEDQAWSDHLETLYPLYNAPKIDEDVKAAHDIANDQSHDIQHVADSLAKPTRRRIRIGGVIAGVAMSAVALIGTGAIKYDVAAHDPDVTQRVLHGDQIMENNSLVYDSSILSGDAGKDIPVVGPILEHVPGVPDFGGFEAKYTEVNVAETTHEEVAIEGGYATGNSQNPVAPDLRLTGVEYQQGRAAAADVLTKIDPAHFNAKTVSVEGLASDEFNGQLGQSDPKLVKLAKERAEVAKQAFIDEAASRDILVPSDVAVSGHEVVDQTKAAAILQIANDNHISLPALIDAYNTGKPIPENAKAAMDEYLGNNRGAQFKLVGNKEVTKQVKKFELAKKNPVNKEYEDILPGEAVVALPLLLGIMYGNIASVMGRHRRAVRRQARKQAQKAGLEL
jgi:hypothetical protein